MPGQGNSLPGRVILLACFPKDLTPEEVKSFSEPVIPPFIHKLTRV